MSTPPSTPPGSVEVDIGANHVLRGLRWPAGDAANKTGPVCLCIHGLAVDTNVWHFVAPALQAAGVTVLCLDLDGHGESDAGNARTPAALAADLMRACERLALRPSCVLAQSLGAWVGLKLIERLATPPPLYAITPVWSGAPRALTSLPRTAVATARFLRQLARRVGWRAARVRGRRDHTRFAGLPDNHMPRFAEEAASVGLARYACLLGWLRASLYRDHHWQDRAALPVTIIGARRDRLWDNANLDVIQRKTAWPLRWIDMSHTSLATEPTHVAELVALLASDPRWPNAR